MKKTALAILLLSAILLLTACMATPPVTSEANFGITVEEATQQLKEEAAALSFNVFETEPEVLDVKPDSGFTYTVAEGVLLALYGTPEGLLNSVYMQVDGEKCTMAGVELVKEYTSLLVDHFSTEEELEDVTAALANVTPMNDMKISEAETETAFITIMTDDTTTYLSIIPVETVNESAEK